MTLNRYPLVILLGITATLFSASFIPIVIAGIVLVVMLVIEPAQHRSITEVDGLPPNARQGIDAMSERMKATLIRELKQNVEMIDLEDTGVAFEMDVVIGNDMLEAYQERVIIPYARIKDLKYWQDITRILINNNRTRTASPTTPASPESFKIRKLSGNPNQLPQ